MSTASHIPRVRGRPSLKKAEKSTTCQESKPFTRSSNEPYNKNLCFFCQSQDIEDLIPIRTDRVGKKLNEAVNICSNSELKTRLASTLAEGDAHAADIKYHKYCFTQNVYHILIATESKKTNESTNEDSSQSACLVELINIIDTNTQNGEYLSMQDIEETYISMLGGEKALHDHKPTFTRRWLKDKVLSELPCVKTVRLNDRTKPSLLYNPEAWEAERIENDIKTTATPNSTDEMKHLYKAAKIVRNSIEDMLNQQKNQSEESGNLSLISSVADVPSELYTLIRWIMVGPAENLKTTDKTQIIDRSVLTISQNLVYGYKSKQQTTYTPKTDSFRSTLRAENAQVVGLGLTVHHMTRNKKLIELLNAHGYCIPYSRILQIETSLANAVVKNTEQLERSVCVFCCRQC